MRSMYKKVLFQDKAKNKLLVEGRTRPKLAVRNRAGQLAGQKETSMFIRKAVKAKPSITSAPAWNQTIRPKGYKPTTKHGMIMRFAKSEKPKVPKLF